MDKDLNPHYINIIFVKESVESLKPFLYSLLDLTNLSFRIISNGCNRDEEQILINLCNKSEKLIFLSMNSSKVIEHGKVLDYLLELEPTDFFSFMDSDIFAIGPISYRDILPADNEVAISSCLPVWHSNIDLTMPKTSKIMAGQFIKDTEDDFLGCTYLASYRCRELRDLIKSMGLSFKSYHKKELPPKVFITLKKLGFDKSIYDTAKVINILLQDRGHKLSYRNINNLIHIGGFSGEIKPSIYNFASLIKDILRNYLPRNLIAFINSRRFNCSKEEADNIIEIKNRRVEICTLIKEIENNTLLSDASARVLKKNPDLKKLVNLYSTYSNHIDQTPATSEQLI
ncbi:hypothetical protein [uncultured Cocleimonas sp.]|uniref:hypothetical protein n=1 Tax=uncultured Cocleimonas sp. TaxID=1051587 RepID=UPI0026261DEB|nr:hypothetical protein [uncultured Cocleimonas sp.]